MAKLEAVNIEILFYLKLCGHSAYIQLYRTDRRQKLIILPAASFFFLIWFKFAINFN